VLITDLRINFPQGHQVLHSFILQQKGKDESKPFATIIY